MQFVHYPVMHNEVLSYLEPKKKDALMVDCTLGEGGHTELFLQKYENLKVIGLDRDEAIMQKAKARMERFGERFEAKNVCFDDFWRNYDGPSVDLVLFDLGISVFHYEESGRGFGFKHDEVLDMRLGCNNGGPSARDVVNQYDEQALADIIYKYGEERYSRRIAAAICEYRESKEIETTGELAQLIYKVVPGEYRRRRIHPATKTFQALRIEVNRELDRIEPALDGAVRALNPGGRIAVITFHSLEDRPVKWYFKDHADELEILTRKPIEATSEECEVNPPSRSAKLRVVEKRAKKIAITGKKNKYKYKLEDLDDES